MKTVTIEHASEAGQQIRGFRAWQDFAKANFPWAEAGDRKDSEFRANVKVRSFGDRRLSMIKADDYRVVRSEHAVRRASAECLKIMWLQHGTMAVEQDGRSGRLVPGMATICDTGRPYRLWLARDAQIVLLALPYTAIPGWARLSQKVSGTALADRTSLRAALAALLSLLDEPSTPAAAANDADPILHAVQWILSASLHQPVAPGKRAPSRLHLDLAHQYVLSHIDDPALSPDELAYALHMSRRTLYQIFKEQQLTPSRYIRDVRLNAVAQALRSTRDARRGILEIALNYGFSDSASFSRIFKAAFGLSPSAWRQRGSTEAISVEHLIGPIERAA